MARRITARKRPPFLSDLCVLCGIFSETSSKARGPYGQKDYGKKETSLSLLPLRPLR